MNILIFKKYAIDVESIELCREQIEQEFTIVFAKHESSYSGEYFKSSYLSAQLSLFSNYNIMEEDWTFPDFKMFNTILTVSISHGKKRDRLETNEFVFTKLTDLNFRLVDSYEKEVN
jgi:hypothetical protein